MTLTLCLPNGFDHTMLGHDHVRDCCSIHILWKNFHLEKSNKIENDYTRGQGVWQTIAFGSNPPKGLVSHRAKNGFYMLNGYISNSYISPCITF